MAYLAFCCELLLLACFAWLGNGTEITHISPHHGSLWGGMKLTIYGSGFAENQFNFGSGQEHLGNHVTMVSKTRSYECEVHKNGCTERQIMCYTVPMVEDEYFVQVKIDGSPADNHCTSSRLNCKYQPSAMYTPTLSSVSPITGPPGSLLTLKGKIISSRYGSHIDASSNNRLERILRVFFSGQKCELIQDFDKSIPYGIHLDRDGLADTGNLTCLMKGTYISNVNGSYLVEAPFGRSFPELDALRLFADNSIAMFQSYASVDSVSLSQGSVAGGTKITISGQHFDDTDKPLDVEIANTSCMVEAFTQNEIVCMTSKKSSQLPPFKGGRGLTHQVWNQSVSSLEEITTTLANLTYETTRLDSSSFSYITDVTTLTRGLLTVPTDGEYSFEISGANAFTKVFLTTSGNEANQKVEIISHSDNGDFTQHFNLRYQLRARVDYYLEIQHTTYTKGSSSLTLATRMYNTDKTASQTGAAVNEKQRVMMQSTVVPETQTVTFNIMANQASVQEVQMLDVVPTAPGYQAEYRLGVDGVFSSLLHTESLDTDIKNALDGLPTVAPDTVSVTRMGNSQNYRYFITFISERGSWPLIEYVALEPNAVTINTTRDTEGIPSLRSAVLAMDGIPTVPIDVDSSATAVRRAVEDLFSVRCPSFLTSPVGAVFTEDFESKPSQYGGNDVTDHYAFCGRSMRKNPSHIMHLPYTQAKSVNSSPYVCLAYQGVLRNSMRLNISYVENGQVHAAEKSFNVLFQPSVHGWHYQCVDIKSLLMNENPEGRYVRVNRIQVFKFGLTDLLVDNVYLGSKKLDYEDVSIMRRLPPRGYLMNNIVVTSTTRGQYNISLYPVNCSVPFPLFTVRNGDAVIARLLAASPPVTGTFDLSYDAQLASGIPANVSEAKLAALLSTIPGMGAVQVRRTGFCHAYSWTIDWLQTGGNRPQLQVIGEYLHGNSASIVTSHIRDGYVQFKPLLGDMLSTTNDSPQVIVRVNGIPSECKGNCSFDWAEISTPEIASITPVSGTGMEVLTITGSGFTSKAQVMLAGVECLNVQVSNDTQLTCDLGITERGVHQVELFLEGKGQARGSVMYEYIAKVTAVSPPSGHKSGGYIVEISGIGMLVSSVTHDQGDCSVISSNETLIACIISPASIQGNVTFTLHFSDGTAITSGQFEFTNNLNSATVTAISTSSGSTHNEKELVIEGRGFGILSNSSAVYLGSNNQADITHWNDSRITVYLPVLTSGNYPLFVMTLDGFADISANNISTINYLVEVTSIEPLITSLFGGTVHSLTGSGFGDNASHVSVKVGPADCLVEFLNDGEIICRTELVSSTFVIDNSGSHPVHGDGYAWNPPLVTIQAGDTVEWVWTAPNRVTDVGYLVQQIQDIDSQSALVDGFSSGTVKSLAGFYKYQFTEAGTFYYWSGPVDPDGNVVMRGRVNVLKKKSFSGDVTVTTGQIKAQINLNQRQRRSIHKRQACTPESRTCEPHDNTTMTSSCSESLVTVTKISPNQGISTDVITIYGMGFSTENCNNVVTIGGKMCQVLYSSKTSMQCILGTNADGLEPGIIHPVSIAVSNVGAAQIQITGEYLKGYTLIPLISTLSHQHGSLIGQQLLTIRGSGFVKPSVVMIGFAECIVQSLTYNEITCKTSQSSEWTGNITASVLNGARSVIKPICESDCSYAYNIAYTPEITSVEPDRISGPGSKLKISGKGFGTDPMDVTVSINGSDCKVDSVTNQQIVCTVGQIAVGSHNLHVTVHSLGCALGSSTIELVAGAVSVRPSSGSIEGGLLITISGEGFHDNDTTVVVGSALCEVVSISSSEIKCVTPPGNPADAEVVILSGGITFPTAIFSYSQSDTPVVNGIIPGQGFSGDQITLRGLGFTPSPSVSIDGVECLVTSSTDNEIVCTLGTHSAGQFEAVVLVKDKGFSTPQKFTFTLSVDGISPTQGSFGGNQLLTISGAGFDDKVSVTICGGACFVEYVNASVIHCLSPTENDTTGDMPCDVVVSMASENTTLTDSFTYRARLTAAATSVTPNRGGTGGGTNITITGTGFDSTSCIVTIDGVECNEVSKSASEIVCKTGPHHGSGKYTIQVTLAGQGAAKQNGSMEFHYIDVWSSSFTWGGKPPPVTGDIVVIPAEQTILLDTDTPVLKVLLIKGEMIFDDLDLELQAENILITNGGRLQVGTEDEPFQKNATITLHGHLRSLEMPIYGAKTLAVRNGTLDLHGIPRKAWTILAETAVAGTDRIVLQEPVDWRVGDKIAIASTGKRHSQSQNEERYISAITSDGLNITLNEILTYEHLGITATIGNGHELEMRAEVGLLSHNVVVRGSTDKQWSKKIEACPIGFDTGEFATQTCFQGRFGEEMGSDEFGAAIMMHAPEPTTSQQETQWVVGRLSNIEVTHAGQAFRLGRYPVHFHLNGNQSLSYVKSCSIYRTFNRAINIHNTHNVLLDGNVIYHVMGGAVFLEDSIETGNIIQDNLAIFVIPSTSLLNDDVTPAAFWITHPTNIVRRNHVAGGSHFGFWYRMEDHPTGPSADPTICPNNAPMGEFSDNVAHSLGWFGLWTFEKYFPMDGDGICGQGTRAIPAVFQSLTAWHCEKGAEYVVAGNVQFDRFFMVNNEKAGIEGKLNSAHTVYDYDGPMIKNSVIAATTGGASTGCTHRGIVLPFSKGLIVNNTEFIGFSGKCAALGVTSITGKCSSMCGGWTYQFEGITWTQTTNKAAFRWQHEACLEDNDGTLTGEIGSKVVPYNPTLDPHICSIDNAFSLGEPGWRCDTDEPFHRFAWNNIHPTSLEYKNALLRNDFGVSSIPWMFKRLTHKAGWMIMMMGHRSYSLSYENGEWFTNTSCTGTFYDFNTDDAIIMKKNLYEVPDIVQVSSAMKNQSSNELSFDDNVHGDWHLDNITLSFMISGASSRNKRESSAKDINMKYKAYQCYYDDCIVPPDPNQMPPPTERPDDAKFWSQNSSWENAKPGWGGHNGDGTFSPPQDGTDVKIVRNDWMVLDTQPGKLNKLSIYGVLEFEPAKVDGVYMNFNLSVTHIFLHGGRMFVGWEDKPMKGNVYIILRGDRSTPEWSLDAGPNVGAKSIGVFGSLDMHGKPRNVYWTRLAVTANPASKEITLQEAVDWIAGEEIVVATSGMSAWQTETRMITAVSSDKKTLTLNSTLKYRHSGEGHTVHSTTYSLAAEVGLLSRNIRIIGEDYDNLYSESFGARIIVGNFFDGTQQWTGNARISNVEFYHTGQEGYIDYYDPRWSIAFLDTGVVTDNKPSYVAQSSFHEGFNTAIGVISAHGVKISHNVIHNTVEAGIRVVSTNTTVAHNLVTLAQARACYQDRLEMENFDYHGAIELFDASGPVTLLDNAVAGSERTGFAIRGLNCDQDASIWRGNVVHGALTGVGILPIYETMSPCTRISGFHIYGTHDYGIYSQHPYSTEIENVSLIDNKLGILAMVYSPASLSHVVGDKYIKISKSLLVGSSPSRNCEDSMGDSDRGNLMTSSKARSFTSPSGGSIGIAFGQFMSGSNSAPRKPWKGLMSYNSIGGLTIIEDVTFSNFGTTCGGQRDYMVSTSPGNDDGQHPVEMRQIQLENVEESSKLFFHRPNVGKINSADCVDMDCDAMKKCMIKDMDGSVLGMAGAVAIPQAEYEWNGDPRRGLGDYRIPKTMLSDMEGNQLNVDSIAPFQGVIGNQECTWINSWTAYKCNNRRNYEMLIIENMDADTETRRVSPVAILGDQYIDLINGPQDHGWCSGYTCRKRISTFMALVATDEHYALHFTATTPQKFRLQMINADATDRITMEVFYAISNRIDVYVDGILVPPLNSRPLSNGEFEYLHPSFDCEYCPTTSSPGGANYQNRWKQLMYVSVDGASQVDLKMSDVIVLTFNVSMTVDKFFGDQIVSNLALFFGVDESKIRIVDIISETSLSPKRSKRAALEPGQLLVSFEIGDPPVVSVNDSVTDGMSSAELEVLRDTLIDAAQIGSLSTDIGLDFNKVYITLPLPDPQDPAWQRFAAAAVEYSSEVRVPTSINLLNPKITAAEGSVIQDVSLAITNSQAETVTGFGALDWSATVTLKTGTGSDPLCSLSGTTTISFVNGFANFTDLILSHSGQDYQLVFHLSAPDNRTHITAESHVFNVAQRPLELLLLAQPSVVLESEPFSVGLEIIDPLTGLTVDNLAWKSLTFTAKGLLNPIVGYGVGVLSPVDATAVFNPTTSRATLTGLSLSTRNMYTLDIRVSSLPDVSYSFLTVSNPIRVLQHPIVPAVRPVSHDVSLWFTGLVEPQYMPYFGTAVYNSMLSQYDNTSVSTFSCTPGEFICCMFTLSGDKDAVDEVLMDIWDLVKKPVDVKLANNVYTSKDEMKVNGEQYYGRDGPPPEAAETSGMDSWLIAAIVMSVAAVFALVVVGFLLIIKKKNANTGKIGASIIDLDEWEPTRNSPVPPTNSGEPAVYMPTDAETVQRKETLNQLNTRMRDTAMFDEGDLDLESTTMRKPAGPL